MNGLETWKHVVIHQPEVIKKALMSAKLKISEIDFFIFHQANKNLLEYLCSKLNISSKKTYTTVEFYGNTADASLAITLNDAIQKKKITKGDKVLISGVGAGFVFGATIFRWY